MSLDIANPWRPLTNEEVCRLSGQLGVYEVADANGNVLYIGVAGGRSLFGLRGELNERLGTGTSFRVEVTSSYQTRQVELLMVFFARHGVYPPLNTTAETCHLGRLSPA